MRFSFNNRYTGVSLLTLVAAAATAPLASAFVPSKLQRLHLPSGSTPLKVATEPQVEVSPKVNGKQEENEASAWECDDEANCVKVPACDQEQCRTSLDVRIHGKWYDLSGWRKAHPAGTHWIDWYDGRDATEVMDAFHSEKGRKMVERLPKSKEQAATMLEAVAEPDTHVQIAFRELRDNLEKEGWWQRDMTAELTQLGLWASLVVLAAATAHTIAPVSIMALSLSFTAAGWLGHDYVHGVDDFSNRLRNFAALCAGLLPTWWSDKHNKHHALSKLVCYALCMWKAHSLKRLQPRLSLSVRALPQNVCLFNPTEILTFPCLTFLSYIILNYSQ